METGISSTNMKDQILEFSIKLLMLQSFSEVLEKFNAKKSKEFEVDKNDLDMSNS